MRKRSGWKRFTVLALSAGLSVASVGTGVLSRAEVNGDGLASVKAAEAFGTDSEAEGKGQESGEAGEASGGDAEAGKTDEAFGGDTEAGKAGEASGGDAESGKTDEVSGKDTESGESGKGSGDETESGKSGEESGNDMESGKSEEGSGENTESGKTEGESGEESASGKLEESDDETEQGKSDGESDEKSGDEESGDKTEDEKSTEESGETSGEVSDGESDSGDSDEEDSEKSEDEGEESEDELEKAEELKETELTKLETADKELEILALEESAAQIDGTGYESLEAAIEAAQEGDTIILLDDAVVPENFCIKAGEEFTLDLNGHTITSEVASTRVLRVEGVLTLKDSSDGEGKITTKGAKGDSRYGIIVSGSKARFNLESGMIECGGGSETAVQVQLGAKFQMQDGAICGDTSAENNKALVLLGSKGTIDGGQIEAGGTGVYVAAYATSADDYPASVVLNDGEIEGGNFGFTIFGAGKKNCQAAIEIHGGTVTSDGAAISGNGMADSAWTTIEITDGELQGVVGMYLPQYGTTTITGGTITGTDSAIEIISGILKMTGGTLILDSDEDLTFDPEGTNGTACSGVALAIVGRTKAAELGEGTGPYLGGIEVYISGGEIIGKHTIFQSMGVVDANDGSSVEASTEASIKKFEITGGKFTGTVLLDDSLKEKIQDGTYHGISGGYFSEEVDEGCITPGCELPKEDEEVKDPEDDKKDPAEDKGDSDDKNSADKENGSTNGSEADSETRYHDYDEDSDDSYTKPDPDSGEWHQDTVGWWYQLAAGGYPRNSWRKLYYNGTYRWYHFGETGYMDTGWFTDQTGHTYYLNPLSNGLQGAMAYGLQNIDGTWYQFMEEENGAIPFGALIGAVEV